MKYVLTTGVPNELADECISSCLIIILLRAFSNLIWSLSPLCDSSCCYQTLSCFHLFLRHSRSVLGQIHPTVLAKIKLSVVAKV